MQRFHQARPLYRPGCGGAVNQRKGGAQEHFIGNEAADRVARKAEERNAFKAADSLWASGLHGHWQELHVLGGHGLADNLVCPLADAAGGHDQIYRLLAVIASKVAAKEFEQLCWIVIGDSASCN